MVHYCKYCNNRFLCSPVTNRAGHQLDFCSYRCYFKYLAPRWLIGIIVGLLSLLVAIILLLIDKESYLEPFYGLLALGIFLIVAFSTIVIPGYYFRIKSKKEEQPEPFLCVYCKKELTDFDKKTAATCPSCSKKIPVCSLCEYFIFGNDKIFEIEPCEHIFHGECLNEWMEKDGTCPICGEKIEKLDLDVGVKF
ncbi:MAG: RING finger domain-containing protein [Candidatus Heimdallarchaeaceae archaeon]